MIAYGNHVVLADLIEWRAHLNAYAIVMVLGISTRAQTTRTQAQEHRSNQLAERGRIYGLDTLLGAMKQIVVVERRTTQTASFGRFEIVNQPLNSYGSSLSGVRNVSLEIALTIVKIARVRHGIIHDIQRLLWLILLILLLLRRGIQRARILLLLLLLTICGCTRRCCRVIIACRGCCNERLLRIC